MLKKRDRIEQQLRETMGDQAYEEAYTQGHDLTPDAVARLLESKLTAVKV
jgi:hypothetical protein